MLQVQQQKLTNLLLILLLLVRASVLDETAEKTSRNGTSYLVMCTANGVDSDTYFWSDTTGYPSILIYTANKKGIVKSELAKDIPKYNKFLTDSKFPVSTSLILSAIELDDEGSYTCELLSASEIIEKFLVHVVVDNAEETFLAGSSSLLECMGFADRTDTYLWNDVTNYPITPIYAVNEEGITKTEKAKESEKYNNFLITSQFPSSTLLTMSNLALEDEGQYTCELLVASEIVKRYTVHVEVAPHQILITCSSNAVCPPPPPDLVPSSVECVCKAVGVYPQSLEILGNGGPSSQKIITSSDTGPDGTYDISCEYRVYPSPAQDSLLCEMHGYVNNVDSEATYIFLPPNCELLVQYNPACTTATLTCSCSNAAPDVEVYSFYDEERKLVGSPQTSETKEVEILPNAMMTFYCRGCNGVNYGLYSFAEKTFLCYHSTEQPRETTTQKKSSRKKCGGIWLLVLSGLFFNWSLMSQQLQLMDLKVF